MLECKYLYAAIVTFLILTLLPDGEVNAAPEPCNREIFEFLFNTERLKKSKHAESGEMDERHKRRKEKIEQLKKIDKVLEKLVVLGSGTEAPEEKSKGAVGDFMSSYFNFLKYLMGM